MGSVYVLMVHKLTPQEGVLAVIRAASLAMHHHQQVPAQVVQLIEKWTHQEYVPVSLANKRIAMVTANNAYLHARPAKMEYHALLATNREYLIPPIIAVSVPKDKLTFKVMVVVYYV